MESIQTFRCKMKFWRCSFLWLVAWAAICVREMSAETFPSQTTVGQWARDLDSTFLELTTGETDITGATTFQKQYDASLTDSFQLEQPDGNELIAEMAAEIAKLFQKNVEALKNLQETAEELVKDYDYDYQMSLNEVQYLNMNDLPEPGGGGDDSDDAEKSEDGGGGGNTTAPSATASERTTTPAVNFMPSKHFGQDVHRDSSGVHIPIEIYEGYPEILNGLKWSGDLDKVFKENSEKFPDIFWQGFGSLEGFLRVYPAARWHTVDELPDLYDVRRRPWYIHGSVSPKDMLILLDTSGSMHGQSFDIMKLAAKMLINTLGEDDFVNVAQFSSNVTFVTPCLGGTLVQANSRNKRLLFDGIDALDDHLIASYSTALEFAYQMFEKHAEEKEQQDGAECHKMIMMFSDGGTEYPEDVINEYSNSSNPVTQNVRIFTYAVGPHPLPTVALKQMACNTKGSFNTITAMGAIRYKIQDYARVLSKPLVLTKTDHSDHEDIFASRDHLGLGLVTTVTLPVFNTSAKSDNQTLAGVVGIDIPATKFESFSPRHKLGPLGYTFALNQNGFLIFHPNLWMDANYLEDPAHIDLNDIEGDSEAIEQLRKAMVDREAGGVVAMEKPIDLEARWPLKGGKKYHYLPIDGTTLTLGLVVDDFWHYLSIPDQNLDPIKSLKPERSLLARWTFCDETDDIGEDVMADLVEAVEQGKCSSDAANHLAWDVSNVRETFNSWVDDEDAEQVMSKFVMTDGGLTLFWPSSFKDDYSSRLSNPYNSSLFRTVASFKKPQFFLQKFVAKSIVPPKDLSKLVVSDGDGVNDGDSGDDGDDESLAHFIRRNKDLFFRTKEPSLHLVSPVVLRRGGESAGNEYVAAVSGVQLTPEYLQQLLMNHTEDAGPQGQNEWDCRNRTELLCFLIDPTARILASNQDLSSVSAGDFLGASDPQLMKRLVEEDQLFDKTVDFNYQALCPDDIDCSFGMRSVVAPTFRLLMHAVINLATAVQSIGYVLFSLLSLFVWGPAGGEAISEYGHAIPQGLHRCTSQTNSYYVKPDLSKTELHERMASLCDNVECKRDYHAYQLENINAWLIVADPRCDTCHVAPFSQDPEEVIEEDGSCFLPKRYRKRPSECFATNPMEISEKMCSSSNLVALPSARLQYSLLAVPLIVIRYMW